MIYPAEMPVNGRKRKRDEDDTKTKRPKWQNEDEVGRIEEAIEAEILQLENKILESRKNYNGISTLLRYMQTKNDTSEKRFLSAVALCRTFCRLITAGSLTTSREASSNEATIARWLEDRLVDYKSSLHLMLAGDDMTTRSTALTLLLRIFKEEAKDSSTSEDQIWRSGPLKDIVRCLVTDADDDSATPLLRKYVDENDDIRYHTFSQLAYVRTKSGLLLGLTCT